MKTYGAKKGFKKGYKTLAKIGSGALPSTPADARKLSAVQAGERPKGTGKRKAPKGTEGYGSV